MYNVHVFYDDKQVVHSNTCSFSQLLNIKSLSKHELDYSNASVCIIQHNSYMLNLMSFATQDGAERTKYLTSHFQEYACTYLKKVLCVIIRHHKLYHRKKFHECMITEILKMNNCIKSNLIFFE